MSLGGTSHTTATRHLGALVDTTGAPPAAASRECRFWQALQDLQIDHTYVIAPVSRRYPLPEWAEVVPVAEAGGRQSSRFNAPWP
jgi:hypothetical protein